MSFQILQILIYLVVPIALLTYGYWYRNRLKKESGILGAKASTIIKNIHYAGLTLCALALLLNAYDFAFRGLWTTRIIIITTLLTGFLLYPFATKVWRNLLEKYYLKFFSWVPFVLGGISLFPYLGIIIIASLYIKLSVTGQIWYEDDTLIIKQGVEGVLGKCESDIWQNRWLLRKKLYHLPYCNDGTIKVRHTAKTTTVYVYETDTLTKPVSYIIYNRL